MVGTLVWWLVRDPFSSALDAARDSVPPSESAVRVTDLGVVDQELPRGSGTLAALQGYQQPLACEVRIRVGGYEAEGMVFTEAASLRASVFYTSNEGQYTLNLISAPQVEEQWARLPDGTHVRQVDEQVSQLVWIDAQSTITYVCTTWAVDRSVFALPSYLGL